MFKRIIKSFIGVAAVLLFAGTVFGATNPVSIRLEQPKSPTSQNTFKITFVTLDVQGRSITVKCFKKAPSDGSFVQFGSDINLSAGGNTGNCNVDGSIVTTNGDTYQFKATAQAGGDSAESAIVTVDYNTSGPGTPTNYSKSKLTDCVYRISFRTADDGGKTVKVELYRSNSDSDLTSTTQVDSMNIGSNTDGHFDNTVPDCGKTYYFAIRAFDSAGNESGIVGDTIDQTTVVTPTPGTSGGAIPVSGGTGTGTGGQVLGTETGKAGTGGGTEEGATGGGEVKGAEEAATPTPTPGAGGAAGVLSSKNIISLLVLLAAAGLIYAAWKRSKRV